MKILKGIALFLLLVLFFGIGLMLWHNHNSTLEVTVDAAKATPPPAVPATAEFTAVTYNVQARPVFDDAEYKFTRIPKVVNAYDIISFQEMFKQHDLMYAGLDHPWKAYHGTLRDWWRICGSGLGTVSKFPMVGVEAMNFVNVGEFQNKPASKGVLLTRLLVGGNPLDIYTTHKAAGHKDDSVRDKPRQAAELVEFVKKHSTPESAVIIMGDFNLRFGQKGGTPTAIPTEAPKTFEGMDLADVLGAICASLQLKDCSAEVNGAPTDDPDHILFRSGSKALLTPLACQSDAPAFYDEAKQPLSDHVPVIGTFRIAPPATQ